MTTDGNYGIPTLDDKSGVKNRRVNIASETASFQKWGSGIIATKERLYLGKETI